MHTLKDDEIQDYGFKYLNSASYVINLLNKTIFSLMTFIHYIVFYIIYVTKNEGVVYLRNILTLVR